MSVEASATGLRVRLREFAYPQSRPLLKAIEFAATPGTVTAIMGGNGCGKTTLLRLIAGLSSSDFFSAEFNGTPLQAGDRMIGIVFQDYRLFPWETVVGNVHCAAEAVGKNSSAVEQCLKEFALLDLANAWPKRLSGGEQARVALARCLVQEPKVLLLDEVFRSVDSRARSDLMNRIAAITCERGLVTLAVTHDIDEACAIADQVLVLAGVPTTVGAVLDRSSQSRDTLEAELRRHLTHA